MSRTYKATGINLKGVPLGESDRLLTILTREFGLIRVIAPGCRKHNSSLSGRSSLFVVNHLLIAKGRSLDKITQAETVESYPGLGQDLAKLTASQYLAELVLCQALSEQPQEELFYLLSEHLSRLEQAPSTLGSHHPFAVLALLTHATFHLLALAGIAPQVQTCCVTQQSLIPNFADPSWRVGFNPAAGGTVDLDAFHSLEGGGLSTSQQGKAPTKPFQLHHQQPALSPTKPRPHSGHTPPITAPSANFLAEAGMTYRANQRSPKSLIPTMQLKAVELALLQELAQPNLLQLDVVAPKLEQNLLHPLDVHKAWLTVERVLRQYAQYHFEQPIRSAALLDSCFLPVPTSL